MKKTLLGLAILNLSMANAMGQGLMPPAEECYARSGWVVGVDAGYGFLGTNESDLYSLPNYGLVGGLIPKGDSLLVAPESRVTNNFDESHKVGRFVWGANVGYDFAISNRATMGVELGYKNLGKSRYNSDYYFGLDTISSFVTQLDVNQEISPKHQGTEVMWHREIKQQAIDLLLTGRYYVYEGVNVFGKLGVALVNAKTTQEKMTVWQMGYWNERERENDVMAFLAVPDSYNTSIWRMRPELVLGVGYALNENFDINLSYNYIYGANGDDRYYDAGMLQGISNLQMSGAANDSYYSAPMVPVNIAYSPAKIYSSNKVTLGLSYKF